ncbi:MAG: hypothetical protein ACE5JP_05950 [Candidatus Bipolaricaulia bacterium]
MAVEDLAEGIAASDTLIAVWYDDEAGEVLVQYGYVSISLPPEDFSDLIELLLKAEERLERL